MTKGKLKASSLTNGERLLIDRRRALLSQKEAADAWSVSLYLYRRWEDDKSDPPRTSVGRLEKFEVCLLKRRRSGLRVSDLAEKIGVSRWWLTQMERGEAPDDILVSWWEE